MTGATVVGIDLSLTSTGLCAIEDGTILELHNVKSKGRKGDNLAQRRDRLYVIANEIVDWVEGDGADLVVIESPSFGSKFGSPHDRSGLWWIVVNALRANECPVAEVAPQSRAKYGAGKGNAKKDVVFAHVLERYSDLSSQRIANDDIADAVILAAMGSRHLGFPVEEDMPEANLDAMGGAKWPTSE